MKKQVRLIIAITIVLSSFITNGQRTNPNTQNEELGKVSWYRDYAAALRLSKSENKPVLILFQEVPGCATCRNYGHNVLSNPLMTEVIQNEFIPLAIFNNKAGADKKVLQIYKEPAWNNPVVRIVDYNGIDIVSRVGNNYSAQGLYKAMESALKKHQSIVPEYMKILGKELYGRTDSRAQKRYYSMYCFWSGEKALGKQEGILNTEAGFMNGREVVQITYDTAQTDLDALNLFANAQQMQLVQKDASYRPSKKDEDFYLQHSNYKYLPLSPLQRTLINSALGDRRDAAIFLSPQQKIWLSNNEKLKHELFQKPFDQAWYVLANNS